MSAAAEISAPERAIAASACKTESFIHMEGSRKTPSTSNNTEHKCRIESLTKTVSFKHQAEIIEASKDHRYFGLFMEQGTGKTHVTIATFTHLFLAGKIDGVLILAPNGVHDNWHRKEIPIHCALLPEQMEIACWHGSDGVRKQERWEYCCTEAPKDKLVILLANIEAVRTNRFTATARKFVERRRFLLVVDESTTIKNPKADQSRAVHKLAKNAAYSRILTGTPITQSPLDLWSQCRALDETALPFPSYTSFRHEFAVEQVLTFGHRSFNKVVGYRNQAYLSALIAPFTKRILKKDCLDLPEKIYQVRYVELTPEQKRIYRDLTKQCLATLEPGVVTVTTAITMMLRLHQVALGYVADDNGNIRQIPHERIKVLRALLDETNGKTIIFCRFLEDIRQIVNELSGDKEATCVVYSGDVPPAGRELAIEQFQNGDAKYFIATKAAARGLTLTAAENVIYYSQGFSLEDRLQSEDRAHRIGQKKNVVYTDLVAQGTIDDRVIEALRQKKDLANSVLNREQLTMLLTLDE